MTVTFSRIDRVGEERLEGRVLFTAYCVACGRLATTEVDVETQKDSRQVLLVMRQLRTELMKMGCGESGVTAAVRRVPADMVPGSGDRRA